MAQMWTIIFIILLAVACALAALNDREDAQQRERREADFARRIKTEKGRPPPLKSEEPEE